MVFGSDGSNKCKFFAVVKVKPVHVLWNSKRLSAYRKGKKYPNRYTAQGIVTSDRMKLVNMN